ncbi:MAG: HPr family phosphocarrier protein [Oscillospiraceae bacterium]|nr:HPr family phosphocarrier protein [Oscillospiraceae bacterium]
MTSVYVYLKNGSLVEEFVGAVKKLEGKFELISDLTVLDAKSILGIYSLNLSDPILLRIENEAQSNIEILKPFVV